jgi:hypothetical protein
MLDIIIKILHLIIILTIIVSPFVNNMKIKQYVFIFLCYLLFQYATGYKRCGLTELEYMVMGKEYKNGFLYRLITPMINIPEFYFDKVIQIIHIILIIILVYQINPIIK